MMRMALPLLMFGLPPLLWSFIAYTFPVNVPEILRNSVTLVVSHPDDELMFFGPTYGALSVLSTNNSEPLNVVSLSNGNAEGLGATREHEIVKAALLMNVTNAVENVRVVNHPQLQDGEDIIWDPTVVADVLNKQIKSKTVVTFDGEGISGHPNHIAVYNGAVAWKNADPESRRLFVLKSVPIYRKYIFFVDAVYKFLEEQVNLAINGQPEPSSEIVIALGQMQYQFIRRAMTQGHSSQMKWYRAFYLQFSRYMVLNELVEVGN